MNSRERLEIVAQFVETLAPPMGPSDAAALRELDQLCEDMARNLRATGLGNHWPETAKILERAAQAGYGEK